MGNALVHLQCNNNDKHNLLFLSDGTKIDLANSHTLHGSLWHTSVVQIVVPSLNIECLSPSEDSTLVLHIQDAGELEQYKALK